MTAEAPKTNPRKIPGRWRDGYALDVHTLSSEHRGYDEFGHAVFDQTRSVVGELLYKLKYRSDTAAVEPLCRALVKFIRTWKPGVDLIVPVPASRKRAIQPVGLIAQAVGAALGLPVDAKAVVSKTAHPEMKDVHDYDARMKVLKDSFEVKGVKGRKVLLLDDLYRSGATMSAIASAMYDDGGAADVVALTITQTRSNR